MVTFIDTENRVESAKPRNSVRHCFFIYLFFSINLTRGAVEILIGQDLGVRNNDYNQVTKTPQSFDTIKASYLTEP
jgi:hypothetical protein